MHPYMIWVICTASTGSRALRLGSFATTLRQPEWYADGRPPTLVSELWVQAIKCTYDSTPQSDKGLRDQVLGYARPYLKQSVDSGGFQDGFGRGSGTFVSVACAGRRRRVGMMRTSGQRRGIWSLRLFTVEVLEGLKRG